MPFSLLNTSSLGQVQRRSSTISGNLIEDAEDQELNDDLHRQRNVHTQEQLGKLWLDLLAMGDTEFLTVARILAEDPELLISTTQAYEHADEGDEVKPEDHREMQRTIIDKVSFQHSHTH